MRIKVLTEAEELAASAEAVAFAGDVFARMAQSRRTEDGGQRSANKRQRRRARQFPDDLRPPTSEAPAWFSGVEAGLPNGDRD